MFSATSDFKSALNEVNILLRYASRNSKNMDKYATFNKSALILLCTKFEAFIEEFLEEYAYECCQKCTNNNIDRVLFNHIIDVLIEDLEKVKNNQTKRNAVLLKISKAHEATPNSMVGFKADSKFSFGRHGQKELTKLLSKFGFKDFNDLKVEENFYISFNSLFNIRNNIIHEDATPSLTHVNVKEYRDLLDEFIDGLDDNGQLKIDQI